MYTKYLANEKKDDKIEHKNLTLATIYYYYLNFLRELSGQEIIDEIKTSQDYEIIYFYFIDNDPSIEDSRNSGWNENFEEKFTKFSRDALELLQKLEVEDEDISKTEGSIEEGKAKNKWKKLCLLHNFVYTVLHEATKLDNNVFLNAARVRSGINIIDISERDNYDCNSKGQVKKVIDKYTTGKEIISFFLFTKVI
uniref:Uncharacterized protein n=1 Tax=Meloidogyne enterolobii TaxID=390850 RepID=A0A6V7UG97_MELEN|nr:unnamed protein product [Meloidogyne enterolobii]